MRKINKKNIYLSKLFYSSALIPGLLIFTIFTSPPSVRAEWLKFDWVDVGWKYADFPQWKWDNGFNGSQYWAAPGDGYGKPYGFEIQTHRSYDLEQYREWLTEAASHETLTFINLECEVANTDLTPQVINLIKTITPEVEIFTGPTYGWTTTSLDDYKAAKGFDIFDALINFYNVGYVNRMGEDFAYQVSQCLHHDVPCVLMPQPVLGGNEDLTIPDEYRRAMEAASYATRGIAMWAADDMYEKPPSPEKEAILLVWKEAQQKTIPPNPIRIPIEGNYSEARSLARIIWHAGYVAHGYMDSEGVPSGPRVITWDDIEPFKPEDYKTERTRFHDTGHPSRKPNQKETVRSMEMVMGRKVRNILISRGIQPHFNANNSRPVAIDDSFEMKANQSNVISKTTGVIKNDSDEDANDLRARVVGHPMKGIVNLNPDGSFVYTPDNNFKGEDRFIYQVNDGTISSNFATVTLAVKDGLLDPINPDPDPEVDNNIPKLINPFYPLKEQQLTIPCEKNVRLINQAGIEIAELMCQQGVASWDGDNVSAGTFIITEEEKKPRKVVVIK